MSQQNQLRNRALVVSAIASLFILVSCNQAQEPAAPAESALTPEMSVTKQSATMVPTGPWGDGDQRGMANTIVADGARVQPGIPGGRSGDLVQAAGGGSPRSRGDSQS